MANVSIILLPSMNASQVGQSLTLPIESVKAKGCGYNGQTDGLHTVQFAVQEFIGRILIQGSLEVNPTDDDWFDVESATLVGTGPLGLSTTITQNFTGNFVWVRAVVDQYTNGNVNQVLFTHN